MKSPVDLFKYVHSRFRNPEAIAKTFRTLGFLLRTGGASEVGRVFKYLLADDSQQLYARWVRDYDTLGGEDLAKIAADVEALPSKPLISVILPTYNTPPELLRAAIDSVLAQPYPNWELCVADDASPQGHVREILNEYASRDKRIRVTYRTTNGHISAASNSALETATGSWITFLDHDDALAPTALYLVAKEIDAHPEARLIYSDEDKVDVSGRRSNPYFKPDWNYRLFLSHNMITHLAVYRRDLVKAVGGLRSDFDGAQDYDFALRAIEHLDSVQIRHIPRILYHWRVVPGSTALAASEKPYAMLAGERALNEHFLRSHTRAKATLKDYGYVVDYELPAPAPRASIIIPTHNGLDFLRTCIDSIRTLTSYPNYEIIVVDNRSDDTATLAYLEELGSNGVRILRDPSPFNFAALNNRAVTTAEGDVLCFLNNDTKVIDGGWLSRMVTLALQPNTGAVGAKLLYGDHTVQHVGIIAGYRGIAGHAFGGIPDVAPGYWGRASMDSEFSAVTAACLVVRKDLFLEAGGFDEQSFGIAFNDVDLCFKLQRLGYRNVVTPHARLFHFESKTRGFEDTGEKRARFAMESASLRERWRDIISNDPGYNPNLTLERGDFAVAIPPRLGKPWEGNRPAPLVPET